MDSVWFDEPQRPGNDTGGCVWGCVAKPIYTLYIRGPNVVPMREPYCIRAPVLVVILPYSLAVCTYLPTEILPVAAVHACNSWDVPHAVFRTGEADVCMYR